MGEGSDGRKARTDGRLGRTGGRMDGRGRRSEALYSKCYQVYLDMQ